MIFSLMKKIQPMAMVDVQTFNQSETQEIETPKALKLPKKKRQLSKPLSPTSISFFLSS